MQPDKVTKGEILLYHFDGSDTPLVVIKDEDGRRYTPSIDVYGNESRFDYLDLIEISQNP